MRVKLFNAQDEVFSRLSSTKDGPRVKPGDARVIGSSKFPSVGDTPGSGPGMREALALSEKPMLWCHAGVAAVFPALGSPFVKLRVRHCLGPLKLCQSEVRFGGFRDGKETLLGRGYSARSSGD